MKIWPKNHATGDNFLSPKLDVTFYDENDGRHEVGGMCITLKREFSVNQSGCAVLYRCFTDRGSLQKGARSINHSASYPCTIASTRGVDALQSRRDKNSITGSLILKV